MHIAWPYGIACLLLLLVPSSVLYSTAAKERLTVLRDHEFPLEGMLLSWQHWLDLLRAAAGAWLLTRMALLPNPDSENGALIVLAATGLVLALAVFAQTLHYRNGMYLLAPVFFVWGLLAILVPPVAVVFAVVFGTALARMLNHVDLVFVATAGLLGTVGYLTIGLSPILALACALAGLPVLISYAVAAHLVCYSR